MVALELKPSSCVFAGGFYPPKGGEELRQAYLDGRPSSFLFNPPFHWSYDGTWAPDGTHFFFITGQPGEAKLHKYDAEADAFTTVATNTGLPSWSGDGKTMVWEVETRTTQLWLMENFP